jgi:putative ABC transport system substrate-binding protein
MLDLGRRQFITLLGGAAAAWPLATRAQQPERLRHIGVLVPGAANDPVWQARIGAFQQALALSGWIIGRNVRIDIRWATTDAAAIRREAEELAALAPDVTLAAGHSSAAPLLQATRTVPIVFAMVQDAVAAGFVDSLARPGGNATGVHVLGIQHGREVAGTAQADCARAHARDGPARCQPRVCG